MSAASKLIVSLLEDETDMSDPVERREVQIANELTALLVNEIASVPELAGAVAKATALLDELKAIHGQ
jgi:hypothetical protein